MDWFMPLSPLRLWSNVPVTQGCNFVDIAHGTFILLCPVGIHKRLDFSRPSSYLNQATFFNLMETIWGGWIHDWTSTTGNILWTMLHWGRPVGHLFTHWLTRSVNQPINQSPIHLLTDAVSPSINNQFCIITQTFTQNHLFVPDGLTERLGLQEKGFQAGISESSVIEHKKSRFHLDRDMQY